MFLFVFMHYAQTYFLLGMSIDNLKNHDINLSQLIVINQGKLKFLNVTTDFCLLLKLVEKQHQVEW